jgi:cofilin
MSMEGVEVDPAVTPFYNDMKLKQTHKFAEFKITDDKRKIVLDYAADPCQTDNKEDDEEQFNKLKERQQIKEPRYILYDFGFTNKEGRKIKRMAFIFW